MHVYVVEWAFTDVEENDTFEIRAFGKTLDGASVALRIHFCPYFFVKTPGWSEARRKLFLAECAREYKANEYSTCVTRYDAWGWTTDPEPFVQLAFDTLKAQRIARARLAKTMATYEGTVDPVVRLCHVRGIHPTGWIRVDAFRKPESRLFPRADIELLGPFTGVHPSDLTDRPPIVLCSWDIEVYSHDGSFPRPEIPENSVIQIASSFQKLGDPAPYRTLVVCLDDTAPIETADIISVGTEADVYAEWFRALQDERVDVMMGWNTWQFDWKYIEGRGAVLTDDFGNDLVNFTELGRGPEGAGDARTWDLTSGAYGQNSYTLLKSPGVLDLDLMQLVKRDKKLESYALNNVAATFLGESKLDLPAADIFKKFRGSPGDRADIARYAAQDVLLPLKLFAKLNMYDNLAQMSVATCVPMDYLLSRGQQIKVFSLVLKQARTMKFVLPDNKAITIDGKFEGATVLQAKKGAYFDVISGLDFASLYPSILRSFNLCYSTLVLPHSPRPEKVYEIDTGMGVYAFSQDRPGIVPKLLENLAVWRKDAKKKMQACKDAGDTFGASVWDSAQLAFKVSMNSVYGFLGASKGMLPCVPIAAAVTATGRRMIETTKSMAERLVPGSEVVYGDSVAGYTPIYVRYRDADIALVTFDVLGSTLDWTRRSDGKEYAECDVDVWSERGWTRVRQFVRHAYASKELIRIVTSTGIVDVTLDHSLLDAAGRPVSPRDVAVGDTLLHADLPEDIDIDPLTLKPHARRWTLFDVAKVFAYLTMHGCRPGIACSDDGYTVHLVRHRHLRDADDTVVRAFVIEYDGPYVYDVTTDNHHFAVGPGRLVVHNTDSVMVRFHVDDPLRHDLREHFRIAQWVADEITKTFPGCVELEFEKCYLPYLLYSKKRYAGLMYTKPEKPDYVDVKGLQLVRRDNAPIVKKVSQAILDVLMYERSADKALAIAQDAVLRVLRKEEPLDSFIVSKSLRGSYANPNAQPHVQVARKIQERTGERLGSGTRVPYVFVVDDHIDDLISKRAEDPVYVADRGLDLDYLYYIDNQLLSPIHALLDILVDDPTTKIMDFPAIREIVHAMRTARTTLVRDVKRVKTNQKNQQREITHFFKPKSTT